MGGIVDQFTGVSQEKKARRESERARGRGLGELSPEQIQRLINMLQGNFMSGMAPQMMNAQQGLAAGAGSSGLKGTGLYESLRAGIPGQFALGALGQSIPSALEIALGRAGIAKGESPTPRSSLQGMFDTGSNAARMYSSGGILGGK